MTKQQLRLIQAEQQILGFYECYQGSDFTDLLDSMGITKKEIEILLKEKMVNYLPKELGDELITYLKK